MMQIEKSVTIQGNLRNKISYKLCPADEFSTGEWFISLSSVSYDAKETFSLCCEVTSNFVVGQKYSENFEVQFYEQPLATVSIIVAENQRAPRIGRIPFGWEKFAYVMTTE